MININFFWHYFGLSGEKIDSKHRLFDENIRKRNQANRFTLTYHCHSDFGNAIFLFRNRSIDQIPCTFFVFERILIVHQFSIQIRAGNAHRTASVYACRNEMIADFTVDVCERQGFGNFGLNVYKFKKMFPTLLNKQTFYTSLERTADISFRSDGVRIIHILTFNFSSCLLNLLN